MPLPQPLGSTAAAAQHSLCSSPKLVHIIIDFAIAPHVRVASPIRPGLDAITVSARQPAAHSPSRRRCRRRRRRSAHKRLSGRKRRRIRAQPRGGKRRHAKQTSRWRPAGAARRKAEASQQRPRLVAATAATAASTADAAAKRWSAQVKSG